jgi:NADH-quinone oxidoreductase subunit F
MLDLQVGFDELDEAGSMMGSGGMIVMDEDTCMVDVARYFTSFLTDESCGKCVPCREGLGQMHKILKEICAGRGKPGDLETLEELSEVAGVASLCALGKSGPSPFLSTLRYFRDEYEAHIHAKRCPSMSCKGMISFYIDPEACKACLICMRKCPSQAIAGGKKMVHVIDQSICNGCGICQDVCPDKFDAVRKISGEPVPADLPSQPVALGARVSS